MPLTPRLSISVGAMLLLVREAVVRSADLRRLWCKAVSLVAPCGSMVERTLMHAGHGLPVPEAASDVLAAAIGNAGLAAWLPLSWRARLQPARR